jgi:hypothetical protein
MHRRKDNIEMNFGYIAYYNSVEWVHVVHDRVQWCTSVNMITKLWFPQKQETSGTDVQLSIFQERPYIMELTGIRIQDSEII